MIADQYHQDRWGLQPLDGPCLVVESRDDLDDAALVDRTVAVFDSRPDFLTALVDWLVARGAPGDSHELRILVPEEFLSTALHLIRHEPPKQLALVGMRSAWGYVDLRFVAADASARPNDDLLAGIGLGRLVSSPGVGEAPKVAAVPDCSATRAQLLNALQFLEATGPRVFSEAAAEEPDVETAVVPVGEGDRAAVEDRLVAVTLELAALRRKYDALAGSRLGRLTLAYWAKRKATR